MQIVLQSLFPLLEQRYTPCYVKLSGTTVSVGIFNKIQCLRVQVFFLDFHMILMRFVPLGQEKSGKMTQSSQTVLSARAGGYKGLVGRL